MRSKIEFIYLYSWFLGVSTMVLFYGVVFGRVPAENKEHATYILGFLSGSALGVVINFFFGTSKRQTPPNSTTTETNLIETTSENTNL